MMDALQWIESFQAAGGQFRWWDKDRDIVFLDGPADPISPVRLEVVAMVKADPARWITH